MSMNLGDPEFELLDPTPNVHVLFVHFDKLFFWTSLASRAIVRWSKRMYSCAGICSYDRVGLCEIALSEPLLKLRPRKDLIETLLHEMIHAYLFITNRDRDRDGHGPNFKAHMHRINKSAGLNISIYHDFHEEVKLYQTHWWRCSGPCQNRKPHFGIVRRSANRAPGPNDYWWLDHQRKCGGTFVKIKEPEPKNKKKSVKQNSDITKYINKKTDNKSPKINNAINSKPNNILKPNNNSTLVVSKKNIVFNPKVPKTPTLAFSGVGQMLDSRKIENITDITETVRNIWAKKFPSPQNNLPTKSSKHHRETTHDSPSKKIKKIDDYFKKSATTILNDIYEQDFIITDKNSKLVVLPTQQKPVQSNLVNCPVCKCIISSTEINNHLDECLNKDIIDKICNNTNDVMEHGENINETSAKIENSKEFDKNVKILTVQQKDPINPGKNKIEECIDLTNTNVVAKTETSNICPCCGKNVENTMQEHLDECLIFFDNNSTIPEEGASTSLVVDTIVLDDDFDKFDETLTLNVTGTKSPCPCCLEMIEQTDMNSHLDACLS